MNAETTSVEVEWSVTWTLSDPAIKYAQNNRFTHELNSKILAQFDVAPRYAFHVVRHSPNHLFHDRLSGSFRSQGIVGSFARLPYEGIQVTSDIVATIGRVQVETFPGDVAVLRMRAKLQAAWPGSIKTLLPEMRTVRTWVANSPVGLLINAIKNEFDPASSGKSTNRFAIQIKVPVTISSMAVQINEARRDIIAFHVGAERTLSLGAQVVDAVAASNRPLNMKSDAQSVVLNEQGLTHIQMAAPSETGGALRFPRLSDLLTIASYMQELLLDKAGKSVSAPSEWLLAIEKADRWSNFPSNVFTSSMTNKLAWDVLVGAFHINSLVTELDRIGPGNKEGKDGPA